MPKTREEIANEYRELEKRNRIVDEKIISFLQANEDKMFTIKELASEVDKELIEKGFGKMDFFDVMDIVIRAIFSYRLDRKIEASKSVDDTLYIGIKK